MRSFLTLLNILFIFSSFLFSQNLDALLAQANNKTKIGDLKETQSLLEEDLVIDISFAPARIGFLELWLRKGLNNVTKKLRK
jgi:hypothetical protein